MATASIPTVVIADDDPGVRQALSELIVAHPDLELAGVADSGPAAVTLCELRRPTVAVVDVMMPGGGREAIAGIRGVSPNTLVVVYTARSDRRTAERMIEAGAELVLVKGGGRDVATELIGVALRGSVLELRSEVVDD
jgi:DNA-binding NarL/FixJ family response regulator